ncbi:hypothetical protein [Streptomyces spiralis]
MPQHTTDARVCPDCDGFAAVAVSLGTRDARGHLRTVTVHCPTCRGLGLVPARRLTSVSAGR